MREDEFDPSTALVRQTTPGGGAIVSNPFGGGGAVTHASTGTVAADQTRAMAEVQAALVVAHGRPRNEAVAMESILSTCRRETFAARAEFKYPRGTEKVTGPSIRLAEEIAAKWGNIQTSVSEVERDTRLGQSVVEAVAWDLQTNRRQSARKVVRHWRDTKKGGYAITDERDISEMCLNQGSRLLRSCILRIVPGDVVELAVAQCRATLEAAAQANLPEARKKILEWFGAKGITPAQLASLVGRASDNWTPADITELRGYAEALRTGDVTVDELRNGVVGKGDATAPAVPAAPEKPAAAPQSPAARRAAKATPAPAPAPEPAPVAAEPPPAVDPATAPFPDEVEPTEVPEDEEVDGEEPRAFDEKGTIERLKEAGNSIPTDSRRRGLWNRAFNLASGGNGAGVALIFAWADRNDAVKAGDSAVADEALKRWKAAGGRGEPSFETLEAAIAMHEIV